MRRALPVASRVVAHADVARAAVRKNAAFERVCDLPASKNRLRERAVVTKHDMKCVVLDLEFTELVPDEDLEKSNLQIACAATLLSD